MLDEVVEQIDYIADGNGIDSTIVDGTERVDIVQVKILRKKIEL